MATRKTQRVAIFAIMIMMVVGTIGSFAVMILATENDQNQSAQLNEALAAYQKAQAEYSAKLEAQAEELSTRYYPVFSQYASWPAEFDKAAVDTLQTSDLRTGSGTEIKGDTAFAAYYIGWNPDGKVFDQSISDGALKTPLRVDGGLDNASLIEGWKEGMVGMKIGGVRLLEIPSDKAYGESGQGDDIPPNTPLKFVVMAIDLPEEIPAPEVPAILQRNWYGGL